MITITVTIPDEDQIALENDLPDLADWVQKMVKGKINNSRKRMVAEAERVLKKDPAVTSMPATKDGLINALVSRDDYQNRAARDSRL